MPDSCCCPTEAGREVCETKAQDSGRPSRAVPICPSCGGSGKPVQGQTVKALLSESLRALQELEYHFCSTPNCPVVYFPLDGSHTFTIEQVRERVYQKEPAQEEVFVCYCFRYKAGEIRSATPAGGAEILREITNGIHAGQCACDLRNPQGSCCLGNVRALLKLADPASQRKIE
jgi:hypothetical protein